MEKIFKAGWVGELPELAIELQAAFRECVFEISQKLAAKQGAEWIDGQEELLAGRDPSLPVQRQSARGYDTVDVGMVFQSLRPSMQNGEETQSGSQPFRIGSHFQKRLRHGTKQNAVNDPRIL